MCIFEGQAVDCKSSKASFSSAADLVSTLAVPRLIIDVWSYNSTKLIGIQRGRKREKKRKIEIFLQCARSAKDILRIENKRCLRQTRAPFRIRAISFLLFLLCLFPKYHVLVCFPIGTLFSHCTMKIFVFSFFVNPKCSINIALFISISEMIVRFTWYQRESFNTEHLRAKELLRLNNLGCRKSINKKKNLEN